jgi:hypothetical protein
MYAATDIKSHITGKIYAPQGAIILVLKVVDNVAFCSYNGKKFPCHINKLSHEKPVIIKRIEPITKPKRRR